MKRIRTKTNPQNFSAVGPTNSMTIDSSVIAAHWGEFLPSLALTPLVIFHLCCPLSSPQITVSVAQGRVRSPSSQPRYKSHAYTQAAYVTSPEQKRRRFTDQVLCCSPGLLMMS